MEAWFRPSAAIFRVGRQFYLQVLPLHNGGGPVGDRYRCFLSKERNWQIGRIAARQWSWLAESRLRPWHRFINEFLTKARDERFAGRGDHRRYAPRFFYFLESATRRFTGNSGARFWGFEANRLAAPVLAFSRNIESVCAEPGRVIHESNVYGFGDRKGAERELWRSLEIQWVAMERGGGGGRSGYPRFVGQATKFPVQFGCTRFVRCCAAS